MVKKSRYIVVTVLFFLTLTIFLTFNPDSYDVALTDTSAVLTRHQAQQTADVAVDVAVVTGDSADAAVVENITRALRLLKRSYRICEQASQAQGCGTVIVAATTVNDAEIATLTAYLSGGGSVIFAVLPEVTPAVQALLGIDEYAPRQYIRGIDVYEGVLLGGLFRAETLEYRCADVVLSWRCKVLVNGYDRRVYDEDVPKHLRDTTPMLWRTYYEGSPVFAFNGPFMGEASGMGLLTGVLAMAHKDFLYPIVGTKSVVLDHFPYFGTKMVSGRIPLSFTRDIVWPGMLSVARGASVTYTCYANNGYADDADAYAIWSLMATELQKIRGELGYTIGDGATTEADLSRLTEWFPSLSLRSLRSAEVGGASLDGVTSVMVDDWADAMMWLDERTISLPAISEGLHDEAADLNLKSALTLMGMVIHRVDMAPLYTGDAVWSDFSLELATYVTMTMSKLRMLESLTVSRATEVAKNYLNTDLCIEQDEAGIVATISGNEEAVAFILRTAKNIDYGQCANCTVEELEEGAYWIESPGPQFTIRFTPEREEGA